MCQEESGPEEALFHRPRTTHNGQVGFLLSGDCRLPTAHRLLLLEPRLEEA